MKLFWDERFSQEAYIYGEAPNVFFSELLQENVPGKLLLPGEGEGRNAVWAATIGWDVTAVDYSTSGKAKALKLAERHKILIDYQIQDLAQLKVPENTYDAVALIFVHLPVQIRRAVHQELVKSLRPGGLLIVEAFHKDQLQYNSGGPKNEEMLYTREMLQQDFEGLNTTQLTKTKTFLNEGEWHSGEAAVVRFVAKKPLLSSYPRKE
ncbi:MAG: class I SAM-dependent methyltransferase [Bacteroidales bacterium]|jgi:SAM-dependent methyltransferase|nr:class I SAM-dependent methyltransferase [Bacteroidales bacterium]MDN5349217.1 hypothetical protein [Bacteroidales bacterium]